MTIPREEFVGKQQRALAYVDEDLPLSGGRCLMEPMVLARLLQALEIRPDDNLLIVGAGCGYGTAVAAKLAGSVIAIETRANLVEKAQDVLVSIGIDNAAIVKSRLVDGYPDEGPYDRILIEGGVETVPDSLLKQLTPKGRLVAIYRKPGHPVGVASLWTSDLVKTSPVPHCLMHGCQTLMSLMPRLNFLFNAFVILGLTF